jgi:proline dehydrogenase
MLQELVVAHLVKKIELEITLNAKGVAQTKHESFKNFSDFENFLQTLKDQYSQISEPALQRVQQIRKFRNQIKHEPPSVPVVKKPMQPPISGDQAKQLVEKLNFDENKFKMPVAEKINSNLETARTNRDREFKANGKIKTEYASETKRFFSVTWKKLGIKIYVV